MTCPDICTVSLTKDCFTGFDNVVPNACDFFGPDNQFHLPESYIKARPIVGNLYDQCNKSIKEDKCNNVNCGPDFKCPPGITKCEKDGDYSKNGIFDDCEPCTVCKDNEIETTACNTSNNQNRVCKYKPCSEGTWSVTGDQSLECKECSKCSEDQIEIQNCTVISDRTCKKRESCKQGVTWSETGKEKCKSCSKCPEVQIEVEKCNITNDTKCKDQPCGIKCLVDYIIIALVVILFIIVGYILVKNKKK
jgi:hypothetical protein